MLRIPVAFLLASIATVSLFAILRALIGGGGEGLAEVPMPPKIEFVRLRRESQIEEKKREKPKREEPEPAPVVADELRVSSAQVAAQTLDIDLSPGSEVQLEGVAIGPGGGGSGFIVAPGTGDRDAIPLVRVDPAYPEKAAMAGLEGWVEVEFTVSTAGTVKDPVVIASSSKVFHNEVVRAVRKWKYQPKIENGRPVERPGVRVLLRFNLEGKSGGDSG